MTVFRVSAGWPSVSWPWSMLIKNYSQMLRHQIVYFLHLWSFFWSCSESLQSLTPISFLIHSSTELNKYNLGPVQHVEHQRESLEPDRDSQDKEEEVTKKPPASWHITMTSFTFASALKMCACHFTKYSKTAWALKYPIQLMCSNSELP